MNDAKRQKLLVLALAVHVSFLVLADELEVLFVALVAVSKSSSAKDNIVVSESHRGGFAKDFIKVCGRDHG